MTTIGFIGVGNMGLGMAANLAKAGHKVVAFDLSADAVQKAVDAGCTAAGSASDTVDGSDALVTMLPAGQHVRDVYGHHVFKWAKPGMVLMDCSTIDVQSARDVGQLASDKGLNMVDAPVSGGVAAASGGTLTFMVGGTAAAFALAQPILAQMGKTVIHAGDIGAGQAAKICNNMLLGISMIGTCEAFALAQKLGLSEQVFFDISSKASGQNWSMSSYCPVPGPVPSAPSNRDYEGGFATALMLKDLKLALDAASKIGAAVPLGAQAEALYQTFANLGGAGKDFSAIIKMLDGSWSKGA
jgi:3-hydroxyisobutyrate dehydrogenase